MIGSTIGPYRIDDFIGAGGMGVVYQGTDTRLGRSIAMKFLPSEFGGNENVRTRFLQEARAASALDHQNICAVYDVGEAPGGHLYIVMPFYSGRTIKEILTARGVIPTKESIELGIQMASGLDVAHQAGIVHRDVKPANVIVIEQGISKLLDFGVAKFSASSELTRTGSALGTIAYMSPEQAKGDTVSGQTDVWSLGAVLYEMTTGRRPFRGEHETSILYSLLNEKPESPRSIIADIPEALSDLIVSCLCKDQQMRPDGMAFLASELRRIAVDLKYVVGPHVVRDYLAMPDVRLDPSVEVILDQEPESPAADHSDVLLETPTVELETDTVPTEPFDAPEDVDILPEDVQVETEPADVRPAVPPDPPRRRRALVLIFLVAFLGISGAIAAIVLVPKLSSESQSLSNSTDSAAVHAGTDTAYAEGTVSESTEDDDSPNEQARPAARESASPRNTESNTEEADVTTPTDRTGMATVVENDDSNPADPDPETPRRTAVSLPKLFSAGPSMPESDVSPTMEVVPEVPVPELPSSRSASRSDVKSSFTPALQHLPAGAFMMGRANGNPDEGPPHRVRLSRGISMSRFEVTVAQFRAFVEATGYVTFAERNGGSYRGTRRDPSLTWRTPGFKQSDNHPVVHVTLEDAMSFASWAGGRLPTEAEWEYAARAGRDAADRLDPNRHAWFSFQSGRTGTRAAGRKRPNDWGLYDMQGNVWELVTDFYSPTYYENSPEIDPTGPESGSSGIVARGGSWNTSYTRTTSRTFVGQDYSNSEIGFRLVFDR